MPDINTTTEVLLQCREGEDEAFERLVTILYDDLRLLARRQRRAAQADVTLNTTGLVHEAYLRLVDQTSVQWQDRQRFMFVAARAMRFILIDHAREYFSVKRGARRIQTPWSETRASSTDNAQAILDLGLALEKLEKLDSRLVRVVECRYFAGLTADETAEILSISAKTVQRDCLRALGWLKVELPDSTTSSGWGSRQRVPGT